MSSSPIPKFAATTTYRPMAWIVDPDRECADVDPDLFFHPEHETGQAKASRTLAAKAVCAACPFQQACKDWARQTRQPYGVFGGEHEDERKAWLRQQARHQAKAAGQVAA